MRVGFRKRHSCKAVTKVRRQAGLDDCAVFQRADVSREADIQALVDLAVARFGRLDCLFNNAGASVSASLDSVTEQDLNGGMQLLVGGVLFGIKHAARVMKQQTSGGSIINKLEQNLARATPMPRSGYASDIANAALFLASEEASFVNGHDLVLDGGRIWQFHERAAGK
jgi:NAD(P)-dependent dehydrogenase (short-subunit alcohol dehydrogenase family)